MYFYECLAAFILLIILDVQKSHCKNYVENMFQNIEILPFLNIVFVRNTGIVLGFLVKWITEQIFFSFFSLIVGNSINNLFFN